MNGQQDRIYSVCRFSWGKKYQKSVYSEQKTVCHNWRCPEPQDQSIAKKFFETKEVTRLVEEKKGCCSSKRMQTVALVGRVIKNFFCSLCPFSCFSPSSTQKEAVAACLLKRLPAWSYREDVKALDGLKKADQWQKTKYAQSKNFFYDTRSDLFLGKSKKYLSQPEQCFLTTPDRQVLNGVFFSGEIKKAVIVAVGLTAFYEELSIDFVYDKIVSFLQKECHHPAIFIVNTRGIGESTGVTSPVSLALDIYVAHQFLCSKENLEADDILIYGHSLGGNYGLRGATLIQQAHPEAKISAVVDRSFLKFSDVLEARFGRAAKKIAKENGLEMSSEEALFSLKGKILTLVAQHEDTIPYRASFAKNVEKNFIEKNLVDAISLDDKAIGDHHIRAFTQSETKKVANWINKHFITRESNAAVDSRDTQVPRK